MRKYHHHAAKMAVKAAFIGRIASRMKCFGGYIAVVLTLLLNGCVDYSDTTQAVSTTIKLAVPTALTGTMALNGHTITLTNADGVKLTATTNAQGEATFANLVPDVYTVSAAWNLSFAEYSQATGDTQVNEGAVVSATLNNQLIDQSTTITLPTTLAIKRSLVISKVFYAGNKDRNNRNSTAAQYIELYNQSDQLVDVAGLYIGLLETGSTPAYTLSNLHTAYNDSIVVCKQVFRIPTSTPHVVQPGGSVVITNSAVNHKVNIPLAQNLTTADYEAKDARGKTQNNPAVAALDLVYSNLPALSNMNLLAGGPNGVVIFKTTLHVQMFPKIYAFGKNNGMQYLAIPKRYVMDGVDILKYKPAGVDVATKRLNNDIDAGYGVVYAVNGYNSEVLYRRVSRQTGGSGQRILQDTNNSSSDFGRSTTINIREYEE